MQKHIDPTKSKRISNELVQVALIKEKQKLSPNEKLKSQTGLKNLLKVVRSGTAMGVVYPTQQRI